MAVIQRTNLPLFSHTPHSGCKGCALEQLEILQKSGVDMKRVCIGHLSDIGDDPAAETHKTIKDREPSSVSTRSVTALAPATRSRSACFSSCWMRDSRIRFFGRPTSHRIRKRRRTGGAGLFQRIHGLPAETEICRREGSDDREDHDRESEALPRIRTEVLIGQKALEMGTFHRRLVRPADPLVLVGG